WTSIPPPSSPFEISDVSLPHESGGIPDDADFGRTGDRPGIMARAHDGILGAKAPSKYFHTTIRQQAKKQANLEVTSEACVQACGASPFQERLAAIRDFLSSRRSITNQGFRANIPPASRVYPCVADDDGTDERGEHESPTWRIDGGE